MSTQALLVEVLLSAFFAIACFRARSGSSDIRGLAPKRLFVLTDRIERLRVSRWQWCSMVVLLLLVRLQRRGPDGCGTYRPVAVHRLSGFAVAKLFAAKTAIAKALAGGSAPLMKVLLHAADFLGKVRRRLRFGALSREPLLVAAVRVERRLGGMRLADASIRSVGQRSSRAYGQGEPDAPGAARCDEFARSYF